MVETLEPTNCISKDWIDIFLVIFLVIIVNEGYKTHNLF